MDAALLTTHAFWGNPEPVSFQTSGSSGVPKQVVISKDSLLISAAAVNQHLGVTCDSVWGLALPTHHVGGFGVAARAFRAGCDLRQFPERWNAVDFAAWVVREGITHTALVPTQVHDLVAAGVAASLSLVAVVVGGGQLDLATGQAARELGWPVLASYGMTEAASQIATQGLDLLGRPYQPFPIPLLPIWQCQLEADGRLRIAGPALFSGYTVGGIFTARLGDWHSTTDQVILENRMISPLGRTDRSVKVLGELVDLEALEKQIIGHAGGLLTERNFTLVALPEERRGQRLIPVVEGPCDPTHMTKVMSAYAQSAASHERLDQLLWIDSLPRTELGKIKRVDLAAWVAGKLTPTSR